MAELQFYHHPHHAHLGDQPLTILDSSAQQYAPRTTMTAVAGDPIEERLLLRLDAIVGELEGLRADLTSRTISARLRRLWATIRRLW